MKQHLPNFLTAMNLLFGCVAVVLIFKGNIPAFSVCIGCCLLFDFADGLTARLLGAYSPMGKELDSLADMVSFGLVPGAILYHLFSISMPVVMYSSHTWVKLAALFPFVITVFSALRLAKFNTDTRQTNSFLGLPTPAATVFVTGLALILEYDRFGLSPLLLNSFVIGGITLVLCFFLVSEIPLFALKFRNLSWQSNRAQYLLLFGSVFILAVFRVTGIPIIIIFYVILSLVNNRFQLNSESTTPNHP